MTYAKKILVIGGTGYTGTHLVREAVARGAHTTGFSRHAPEQPIDGADYVQGEGAEATGLIADADAAIATLAPRGETAGRLGALYQSYAEAAAAAGTRLIVVGGFSSLRPAEGQPRFAEGDVPEQFRAEAQEMDAIREWFATSAPASLDWTFVSPAGGYGAWAAGERTGSYRVGGEIAIFDDEGRSEISGADFAVAILDEIESDAHPRAHIGIAY